MAQLILPDFFINNTPPTNLAERLAWLEANSSYNLAYRLPVDSYLLNMREILSRWLDAVDFESQVRLAFGNGIDAAKAKAVIRDLTSSGSFLMPTIEVRSWWEINGARGAFAGATNTIYLSREFLAENRKNPSAIASVVLEEIGHAIDFRLNASDTPGDEGELFSALVRGVLLNERELHRIKAEDDSAIVTIDGQSLQLEQSDNSLGLVEGNLSLNDSVSVNDYGDKWTFRISTTGGSSNYVSVTSNSVLTYDLVLQVTDQNGITITSDDFTDYEVVSLANAVAGTYTATVYDKYYGQYLGGYWDYYYYGYYSPVWIANNLSYTLTINAPRIPPDIYESNNTWQTAKAINTTDGYKSLDNLTIHSSNDTDFFKFTTARLSTDENYIAAYFDWTQGVIDMNLFDGAGNFLYYTLGSYGWNYISLAGLPAGTY